MLLDLKVNGPDTIIINKSYKFLIHQSSITTRKQTVSYKCTYPKCSANLVLAKSKDEIISADFRHSHSAPSASLNTSNQSKNYSSSNTKIKEKSKSKTQSAKPPSLSNTPTNQVDINSSVLINTIYKSPLPSAASPMVIDLESENKENNQINSNTCVNDNEELLNAYSTESPFFTPRPTSTKRKVNYRATRNKFKPNNKTKTKKIYIFSDSHGRGLSALLRDIIFEPDCEVFSLIKPNATFQEVTSSIPEICKNFGPNDIVIVLAGTNDIPLCKCKPDRTCLDSGLPWCQFNSTKMLNLQNLKKLAKQTNIIVNSVPYRFDKLAFLSTNIFETNNFLSTMCRRFGFHFFDNISFLTRRHFTKHGLHLNRWGKRLLVTKLNQFLSSLIPTVPDNERKYDADTSFILYQSSSCVTPPTQNVIIDPFVSPILHDEQVYSIPTLSTQRVHRNEMDFRVTTSTQGT
uniref:Uncharacterized protein n=1 Tax=Cacopsylla melanoneura TaxID=428564 RepID=A0A8D9BMT8_9HEMI